MIICLAILSLPASADDWPFWRYDAGRTAASPAELPRELHLQWVRELPPLTPAWPDQPRLQFDAFYEPVVLGQTLFVGSPLQDSVTAYDTRTGAERWVFRADGPVRFAPAAWEGRVYVASDDGFLYCLDAAQGTLLWKFRGGPDGRRVLGNGRLVSAWPARGAPVVADGVVYFAASLWPFMGTFLHALDARSGAVVWTNEGDGSMYIKQPHNTESFAGVAPQGPLAVAGDRLLIPGGRSIPACYDRRTGKMIHFPIADQSRRGGFEVAVRGRFILCGESLFEMEKGAFVAELGRGAVLAEKSIFYAGRTGDLLELRDPKLEDVEVVDKKGAKKRTLLLTNSKPVNLGVPWVESVIQAGGVLYAAGENSVVAVDLAAGKAAVRWRIPVEGTPARLLAADDRLFVVTREGRLLCLGGAKAEIVRHPLPSAPEPVENGAQAILDSTGVREGYAVVAGAGALAEGLARGSRLHVIALDPEPEKVDAFRRRMAAAGLYGSRVAALVGDPGNAGLPPYLASLLVAETFSPRVFEILRPHGGAACLELSSDERRSLEAWASDEPEAEVETKSGWTVVRRPGPLPGAGDWTHEHADAANTRVSRDRRVRAPLGLLWFGGSSNASILPRHGHGPQPQVLDGRLFIEGPNLLRAMDIYTGRVLWEADLPGVGRFYDNTAHQPGANASGTNFISTPDAIYVAYRRSCLRLDPATGKRLSEFAIPAVDGKPTAWGYLNVVGDHLIGSADPLMGASLIALDPKAGDDDPNAPPAETPDILKKIAALKGDPDNMSSSRELFVMDRHSGRVLWTAKARSGFRHNAICAGAGRLYCIDRLSGPQVDRLKRRGEKPAVPPRLVVFDLATGKELWSTETDVFGTWLSLSERFDILVEAGRYARDTIKDEPKGMRAYRASDGAILWQKNYTGPAMIHGDTILMADRGCDLRTGAPKMRTHPLTGQPVEWTWTRNYGCNTPSASEHLMTFRSGAAGYFDLASDGGTGNFGGFRSSCTNNLVVAGGVLTVPDYTRTCTCSYQNQTSIGLVPMPDAEMWTFFGSTDVKGPVRSVGINLGAPGDRRAPDGLFWVEHPSVGGKSPSVSVSTSPDKPELFRRHAARIGGTGLPWVSASGARGLKSATVTLDKDGKQERPYTVRLHFVEPDGLKPGERVFDVYLQGKRVLEGFDIAREAGGADRALVKEFPDVPVKKELKVEFKGAPSVLCGIEAVVRCNVPVFRYALERWEPDAYEAALFHKGALADAERAAAEALLKRSRDGSGGANFVFDRFDLEKFPSDRAPRLLPKDAELPYLVVGYPERSGLPGTVFGGRPSAAEKLADSPVRRELVRRLLSGDSAVWLFLDSGKKEADDAAAALLEAQLKKLEKELKLPELTEDKEDELRLPNIPLRLAFSMIRVSRDDPAEEVLVRTLVKSEPDLAGKSEIMAFPVFGRARTLGALIGAGLSAENIARDCALLIGPCSCRVKEGIEGFDLLVTANWPALFKGEPVPVPEIPKSMTALGPAEPPAPTPLPEEGADRSLLWGVTGLAALLVAWTLIRLARGPKA